MCRKPPDAPLTAFSIQWTSAKLEHAKYCDRLTDNGGNNCISVSVDGFSYLPSAQDRRHKTFCNVQLELGRKPVKESVYPRPP